MKRLILSLIRAYQAFSRSAPTGTLSLAGFSGCRQWPTCSDYAIDVIGREGALMGLSKTAVRVLRCNPLWPASPTHQSGPAHRHG